MSAGNITLASNTERKIIDNINIPLLGISEGHEKGGIVIHMMSAPIFQYPFIFHRMR
jgi:hypothetical protein